MMKPFSALFLAACATLAAHAAEPTAAIVRNGRAVGAIVVDRRAHAAEQYAGEELQKWIGEITGAYVPVIYPEQTNATHGVRLWIGAGFARKLFPDDFRAIGQTDGFAVRAVATNGVTDIHLFGAVPCGTLHAAYAFLERNSDIIWARPDPVCGTVFGKSASFAAADADFREVPKSRTRGWQWIYHSPSFESEWQARNRMNRVGPPDSKFAGCFVNGGHGHGIQVYAKAKETFETHPDWFPLVKGKRSAASGQICLTAYDMIPFYVSNMVAEIQANYPAKRPDQVRIDYFNISCADNWTCCECERCMAPFTCENGTVVQPDDARFRSAQCFTFLNKVAREIRRRYPHVTVGTYAYEFTLEPPPFALEPNVAVEYCPYGLNEKAPIYDDDTNASWHRLLDAWCSYCRGIWVRQYLGWANTFPRSVEYPVRDNGLYYLKLKFPVAHFSAEHPVDSSTKVYALGRQTWDVSGLTTWCISRMWWDPTQDLEALRDQYCRRAYREAYEPMKKFHDLVRDCFNADRMPSLYNSGDPLVYTAQYILRPGRQDEVLGLLRTALAKARHPVSRELVARQLAHFERWIGQAAATPPVRLTVRRTDAKPDELLNAFDSPLWDAAESTGDLVVNDREGEGGQGRAQPGSKALFRSTARLLHDGESLYLRFDCWAPDMDAVPGLSLVKEGGIEKIPRGDIMEFFLGLPDRGVYYQWMMDMGHPEDPSKDAVYDACVYDNTWTCDWERKVKAYPDRWVAIVRIPFEGIGVNAVQTGKLLFQPIRGKYYDTGRTRKGKDGVETPVRTREMASWNGGGVHQMQTFGELVLELK